MITTRDKEKKPGALIKELDALVSLFVRMSAADDTGTIRCISCGQGVFWKEANCCHYEDRDNMGTRFYLPNLAAGCVYCNKYNHYNHLWEWSKKMSTEQLNDLSRRAKSMEKFTRYELSEMIEDYKIKVSELRKQKGL